MKWLYDKHVSFGTPHKNYEKLPTPQLCKHWVFEPMSCKQKLGRRGYSDIHAVAFLTQSCICSTLSSSMANKEGH